ncbi:MAG: ABC transporter ATP-binding protein [Planctomycetales bacterium]
MHISLENVTKKYGSVKALDGVSLEIALGEIVAVLGANGAGKTTLLRCLGGIAAPTGGEIRFDGRTFDRDSLDQRKQLFLLPDFPSVNSELTVLRHIGLVLRLYEVDHSAVEEPLIKLLREFDLLPLFDARLGTLSRGETYKAALTALVAADPELWMLDEPFASGMDPRGLAAFRRQAKGAAQRGRTVIFTTQVVELAEAFADRVCIMHRGRIHAFDRMERLRADYQDSDDSPLAQIFEQLHEAPP